MGSTLLKVCPQPGSQVPEEGTPTPGDYGQLRSTDCQRPLEPRARGATRKNPPIPSPSTHSRGLASTPGGFCTEGGFQCFADSHASACKELWWGANTHAYLLEHSVQVGGVVIFPVLQEGKLRLRVNELAIASQVIRWQGSEHGWKRRRTRPCPLLQIWKPKDLKT